MDITPFAAAFMSLLVVAIAVNKLRSRRGRRPPRRAGSIGPGAAGAFYELLNEDRRKAIEIVCENRAGYRDPEDADGNLPELEDPAGQTLRR